MENLEDRVVLATMLGLDGTGTQLLRFDSATPGTIDATTNITGLNMGENVEAIDFRPATGGLYGLGFDGTVGRLLLINPATGAASQVGGNLAVSGTDFGIDFNPVVDRLRVVSDTDINLRINPNDGTVSTDMTLNPGAPNVEAVAYINNFAGTTTTTLFDIDSSTDQLFTQNPPNNGALIPVGNLGVNTTASVGFDISGSGSAFASLTVAGTTGLFSINTTTGAATLVGNFAQPLLDIAVVRFVWDGDVDNNWMTAANWVGDIVPQAGDDLVFPDAAARKTNNNNFAANTAFNSITFTGVNYVITGAAINLAHGVFANVPTGVMGDTDPALNLDLTLTAPQSITSVGARPVAIGGAINLNGNLLTVTGTGATMLTGAISGGAGLTKNGTGALTLGGATANTYTGTTTVNQGTLTLSKTAAVAVPAGLTVSDGVLTATVTETSADQIANSSAVTVNATGTLNLNGQNDTIASATINAGGVITTGAGLLTVTGVTTINGRAVDDTLVVAGAQAALTLTLNGTGLGTVNAAGGVAFDGAGQTTADTVTGPDALNNWAINAANTTLNTFITLTNVESLVGGSQADAFVFGANGVLTGTINAGAGPDLITGDNNGRSFNITALNAGSIGGQLAAGFTNVERVIGGTGNDTFNVGANGSVVGTLDGGAHAVGDTLNLDANNQAVSLSATSITIGAVTTTFQNFEAFNVANPGAVTLPGTAGADTIRIRKSNLGTIEVSSNSGPFASIGNPTSLTLNGLDGADTAIVDYSNTSPIPAGGLVVNGGDPTTNPGDVLRFEGGDLNTLVYNATGPGAGAVVINGTDNITFTGLEPVIVTSTVANVTITISDALAHVTTLTAAGAGSNTVTIDGGLESMTFTNPTTSLVINGNAQNDTITFTSLDPNFNANITVNGNAGSNAYNVNAVLPATPTVTFNGGASADTLTVANGVGNTFSIANPNAGSVASNNGAGLIDAFTAIENLVGGAQADIFAFTGGELTGSIDGAAGSDEIRGDAIGRIFNLSAMNAGSINVLLPVGFSNIENLTGNAGDDQFLFSGGQLLGRIDGALGNDILVGDNGSRTFVIASGNGGSVSTILPAGFANIENLTGGTGNDSFQFAPGGSLTGAINGLAGTDNLTGDNLNRIYNIVQANGGSIGGILPGGFANIENLIAGSAADTFTFSGGSLSGTINGGAGFDELVGDNAARAYTISAADVGSVNVLVPAGFSNIENLTGGSAADFFGFVGASPSLTGRITGGAGNDEIAGDNTGRVYEITAADTGSITVIVAAGFAGVERLTGGTGADTFAFNGGTLTGAINGGAGNDQIRGDNVARNFAISGANIGSVTVVLTAGFVSVEHLAGGSAADTFGFGAGANLTGTIDGGAGRDEIIGDNVGRSYGIVTVNGGSISGILNAGFANVENLTAGNGADSFAFGPGSALGGFINGGNGNDRLTGDNTGRVYEIAGANSGSITGILASGFGNVENLIGGAGGDTFCFGFNASLTGNVNGGAGSDELLADGNSQNFAIQAANSGSVTGHLPAGFTDVENLAGGGGADTFQFGSAGSLAGAINGGSGNDEIVGDNAARQYAITAGNLGSITGILAGGFNAVENLTAGSAADTFQFLNGGSLTGAINAGAGSDLLMGDDGGRMFGVVGPNVGSITGILPAGFAGVENLTGGAGSDWFAFGGDGSLNGRIDALNPAPIDLNTLSSAQLAAACNDPRLAPGDGLSVAGLAFGVSVDLGSGTIVRNGTSSKLIGGDFSGVENFLGTSFADVILAGTNSSDTSRFLAGNGGDDTILARNGAKNVICADPTGTGFTVIQFDPGLDVTFNSGNQFFFAGNISRSNVTKEARNGDLLPQTFASAADFQQVINYTRKLYLDLLNRLPNATEQQNALQFALGTDQFGVPQIDPRTGAMVGPGASFNILRQILLADNSFATGGGGFYARLVAEILPNATADQRQVFIDELRGISPPAQTTPRSELQVIASAFGSNAYLASVPQGTTFVDKLYADLFGPQAGAVAKLTLTADTEAGRTDLAYRVLTSTFFQEERLVQSWIDDYFEEESVDTRRTSDQIQAARLDAINTLATGGSVSQAREAFLNSTVYFTGATNVARANQRPTTEAETIFLPRLRGETNGPKRPRSAAARIDAAFSE